MLTEDSILRTERALRGGRAGPQCSLPVNTYGTAARTDVAAVTELMFARSLSRSDALTHLTGHDLHHMRSRVTRSHLLEPALPWMDGGQRTPSDTARRCWAGVAAESIWHKAGTWRVPDASPPSP